MKKLIKIRQSWWKLQERTEYIDLIFTPKKSNRCRKEIIKAVVLENAVEQLIKNKYPKLNLTYQIYKEEQNYTVELFCDNKFWPAIEYIASKYNTK